MSSTEASPSSACASARCATSIAIARILASRNSSHGGAEAQQCTNSSPPTASAHWSNSAVAVGTSTGCTGENMLVPDSLPSSAAGRDGSSICTTTGTPSLRDSVARCCARPSANDAATSRTAPGSVIARWPLGSSSSAASVTGPGP
ncbi:Uncharacterised protein [Mycobacteroides abscessus subsp. abscessus]|nr:Uncharacterised protein [Mycobacteroides abscessus subsp. abscessus]